MIQNASAIAIENFQFPSWQRFWWYWYSVGQLTNANYDWYGKNGMTNRGKCIPTYWDNNCIDVPAWVTSIGEFYPYTGQDALGFRMIAISAGDSQYDANVLWATNESNIAIMAKQDDWVQLKYYVNWWLYTKTIFKTIKYDQFSPSPRWWYRWGYSSWDILLESSFWWKEYKNIYPMVRSNWDIYFFNFATNRYWIKENNAPDGLNSLIGKEPVFWWSLISALVDADWQMTYQWDFSRSTTDGQMKLRWWLQGASRWYEWWFATIRASLSNDISMYVNILNEEEGGRLSDLPPETPIDYESVTLPNEQEIKNYNLNMCTNKRMTMSNDFTYRSDVYACKLASNINVAMSWSDVFSWILDLAYNVYDNPYSSFVIPWSTWDLPYTWVQSTCENMMNTWRSLMLSTRDSNIKVVNDQFLSISVLISSLYYVNTNNNIPSSVAIEDAWASCQTDLDILYWRNQNQINSTTCTWIGCKIENLLNSPAPTVNSWIAPLGEWIGNIWIRITSIYQSILGTNSAIGQLTQELKNKIFGYTWINNINVNPNIDVTVPEIEIPDININMWEWTWEFSSWFFSPITNFFNEYLSFGDTQIIEVNNYCKANGENYANLIYYAIFSSLVLSLFFLFNR